MSQIPPEKWWEFFDRFTRIDEELAVIIKQNNEIINLLRFIAGKPSQIISPPTSPAPAPTVAPSAPAPAVLGTKENPLYTVPILNDDYRILSIDLSVKHVDKPLGLEAMGIVATSMTIIQADSDFYYKLNDARREPVFVPKGSYNIIESDFRITEIYITNEVGSGYAKFRIEFPTEVIL